MKVQFHVDQDGKPVMVEGWIRLDNGEWIMIMFTIEGDVFVDGVKQDKP